MKKIIVLALLATMMVGCDKPAEPATITTKEDSCEYIKCYTYGINAYVYSHRGNCRFCVERNKKMIKEQIDTALLEIFD